MWTYGHNYAFWVTAKHKVTLHETELNKGAVGLMFGWAMTIGQAEQRARFGCQGVCPSPFSGASATRVIEAMLVERGAVEYTFVRG